MTQRSWYQRKAQDAIKFDRDNAETVTFRSIAGVSYDTATSTETETTEDFSIRARFEKYTQKEVERSLGVIEITDYKVVFAVLDLDTTPKRGDKVILGSETFTVIEVSGSFKNDYWTLRVRKP